MHLSRGKMIFIRIVGLHMINIIYVKGKRKLKLGNYSSK